MRINRQWISVALLLCATFCPSENAADEETVWNLEKSYWEDVKNQDLASYRELWHPNFLGWPIISPHPVGSEHITDWITANSDKGLRLSSYSLKREASRETENLVVVHYRLTSTWVDKDGEGEPHTLRISHTWIRTGNRWKIISGMSASEPEKKK